MRPLIGITPSQQKDFTAYFMPRTYSESISRAGGLPIILPYVFQMVDDYLERIDGLLLSGGVDTDPLIWKEEPVPGMGRIDPDRDRFEISLIKKALERELPILGICRGCQILNVAVGGTLIQDLEKQQEKVFKHYQDAPRWYPTHTVIIEEGTKLYQLFGRKEIRVNSVHHQAIKDVGPGFTVSARAKDGVVEAIEKEGKGFVLGVQWHPEAMWEKDSRFLEVFKRLIEVAASR